jgi:hypothetical protein
MENEMNAQIKMDRNTLIAWALRTHGGLQMYRAWNGPVRRGDWKKTCVARQGGVVHLMSRPTTALFCRDGRGCGLRAISGCSPRASEREAARC